MKNPSVQEIEKRVAETLRKTYPMLPIEEIPEMAKTIAEAVIADDGAEE